jgi:nitroimidazol reductase NimA-like FMN-containing flavoprotein (pyridoxamine 5'-phosphate oxidase superfamily)
MRRARQAMNPNATIHLLQTTTGGVLSLVGDNGYPYGVPLTHVYLADAEQSGEHVPDLSASSGRLYFHSAVAGHKIDAIAGGCKACYTVIARDFVDSARLTTLFESVVVFGRVRRVVDEDEKRRALEALAQRYAPQEENSKHNESEITRHWDSTAVLAFDIEHMSGKVARELLPKDAS